jgi:hypothetical protein
MLEPDLISRIRHIFLHPRPHVSISQATGLLGWSRRQMSEAIEAGEVELWTTPVGKWFPRAEMMAKALEIWPVHVIEEALGDEANGVLPQAIRSAELRVWLAAASHRRAGVSRGPAGDDRQRRAGAGAGRHRQRAHRGAVGGVAGVRRGDGLAGWRIEGLSADDADRTQMEDARVAARQARVAVRQAPCRGATSPRRVITRDALCGTR